MVKVMDSAGSLPRFTAQPYHGPGPKTLGKTFIFECLSFLTCKMGMIIVLLYRVIVLSDCTCTAVRIIPNL